MTFQPNQKVICIDFNGVLDTYEGWKGESYLYPMRPGTKEFLEALKSQGYRLMVLTAMDKRIVKQWLKLNKINHLIEKVTNTKIPAIIYLDDRGLQFNGDYAQTLEAIKNFKTHWGGNT